VFMRSRTRALSSVATTVYLLVLLAAAPTGAKAQYSDEIKPAAGKILVASEKLGDPNFDHSVILLIESDAEKGSLGLVINRQSDIQIAGIFPDSKNATKDPVYFGGPVQITGVQALLRMIEKTDQARQVVGDVYVTGTKELIEKSIDSRADASKFRLYLGYAGWAAGQLEAEMRVGAWTLMNGSSKIVFDAQPDSLWERLRRESKMRLAEADELDFGAKRKPVF
jgi:putative transcriptional regulator